MKINIMEAEYAIRDSLPKDILLLADLFINAGFKLYLVGGSVRDSLLGQVPKDWDVCTDATPDKIVSILTLGGIVYQEQGAHFGVVVARMEEDVEIATFRTDVSYSDNRHPEIKIGVSIDEDVKRRDFTINAMFYDIYANRIVDLVNGVRDLENRLVRCVGTAEDRFEEDHLRKLRAVRFAARLGFDIESSTLMAIVDDPELNISRERVVNEFMVGFQKAKSKYGFMKLLIDTGLIVSIFPKADLQIFLMNPNIRHDWKDVAVELYIADLLSDEMDSNLDFKAAEYLVGLGFETRLAKGVEFLLKLSVSGRQDEFNPNTYVKLRPGCDLTDSDILIYNNKAVHVRALLEWKPDATVTADLMGRGLKGKDLGDALKQFHVQSYKDILNRIENESTPQPKTT